jgi:hypothetical protein
VLAYAPVRGPVAAFGASAGGSGAVAFDAGASISAPGTAVARYDWSFGDGTTLANGGPAPAHTYPGAGAYTATVTVTDSFGCSAAGRFGGAMSSCAPSPAAVAAHIVVVGAPPAAAGAAAAAAAAAAGSGAGGPAVTPAAGTTTSEAARPEGATAVPAVSGANVLLSWTRPAGADPQTRYLVAWSTLHSAHGPGDPNMHHIRLTGRTSLSLRTRPGTTLHLAVYAWAADGSITRPTKTTLRLPRA